MNRIKEYFEEQIKTDEALKNVYSEEKLQGCWTYIKDQARKQAKNGCAMIEYSVVYHWARDYMFGDIPEVKEASNSPAPEETTLPTTEEDVAEFKTDEEAETSEQVEEEKTEIEQKKLVIESVEQEETPAPKVSKKEKPADDQQWLFDFD